MKREDLIELAKQQAAEIARAGHNGWGNTMLALAAALESNVPVGVARAWQEGYRQGVLDERASEDNIGIAGFGAKVEPARNNPYALAQQPAAVDEAMVERACKAAVAQCAPDEVWPDDYKDADDLRAMMQAALTAALAAQPGGDR